MLVYSKTIEQILTLNFKQEVHKNKIQNLFKSSIKEIKNNHQEICQFQNKHNSNTLTYKFIQKIINSNIQYLYVLFVEYLQQLYAKDSVLLQTMYCFIPLILRKYIDNHEQKNNGLQKILGVIYTNEVGRYNKYIKEKHNFVNSPFLSQLYEQNFHKKVHHQPQNAMLLDRALQAESNKLASYDKKSIKILLFYLVYTHIDNTRQASIKQYLKTIFIYCGGEMKTYENISSFYLLQKKNLFNPFSYSISEQQIQWILLTLYELSLNTTQFKYQLIAAVNMIYKKTANQSMFKQSQLAQSIIHLLQDQYSGIF